MNHTDAHRRCSSWRLALPAAVAGVVLIAGCGSQTAPGGNSTSPSVSITKAQAPAKPSTKAASPVILNAPTGPAAGLSPTTSDDATIELADALNTAAHAGYTDTFGSIALTKSQRGIELQMTDLAQGRKLLASVRAHHPTWSAVPVALVKVPYTEKRLMTAQSAVTDATWKKYQLVSVGYGTAWYLQVGSSDTRLKAPVAGRAARDKLAQTLTEQLGVRVLVTYATPAHAA